MLKKHKFLLNFDSDRSPILPLKIDLDNFHIVKAKKANSYLSKGIIVFFEYYNAYTNAQELFEIKSIIFEKFMNSLTVTYVNQNGKLSSLEEDLNTNFYLKK